MFKKTIALSLLLASFVTLGLGCKDAAQVPKEKTAPVALQYWGVYTDSSDMDVLVADFKKRHPNIDVQYRKFRPEEYEQKLLEAFAEDRGPDLFTIHNTWLKKYLTRLAPMPDKFSFASFVSTGGGISQSTEVQLVTKTGLGLKQIRDQFVGAVEGDVMALDPASPTATAQKKVFALPFYVDTLAMFYNKDLLAQSGVVKPAQDWLGVLNQAEKLTKISAEDNRVVQSMAALGTGTNVHRAGDIVLSLMMQNGARISLDDGRFVFNQQAAAQAQDEETPGAAALHFYLDFGNPRKKSYTWSPETGDSLEAFTQGRVAYYFGYSYDLPTIKARNPRLNFDIAPLPVPKVGDKPINIANYWMEAVSKKSTHKDEAWLFIMEQATAKEALTKYLAQTRRAAAFTEVVSAQAEDLDLGVFAKQNLTARSWYRGRNPQAAEQILVDMIEEARNSIINPPPDAVESELYQKAVNRAVARLNDTL